MLNIFRKKTKNTVKVKKEPEKVYRRIKFNEFIGCLYVSVKEIDRDIKEKLKSKLLMYEIPRFFLKCDALPRTSNGKVFPHEVQAYLQKYIKQE